MATKVDQSVNDKKSGVLLREEEVGVLMELLTSLPLSGFNSKSHGILVTLLKRMRMHRGELVE